MDIVVRNAYKKTFGHVTSIEIPKTWDMFIPGKSHFKKFMRDFGVSIVGCNQNFVDIMCINNWAGAPTSRALLRSQSLERRLSDNDIVLELGHTCDITLLQFLELLKIHEKDAQYCGLHTSGVINVAYLWPPETSIYHNRLCAISFFHMVVIGSGGGWVFNATPINNPIYTRHEGAHVISRCFARDIFRCKSY